MGGLGKYRAFEAELLKAYKKHPEWSGNLYECYTVLCKEVGEVGKALLDFDHAGASLDDLLTEVSQSGAMCMRFFMFLQAMHLGEDEVSDVFVGSVRMKQAFARYMTCHAPVQLRVMFGEMNDTQGMLLESSFHSFALLYSEGELGGFDEE
jgi:hypothetical protein